MGLVSRAAVLGCTLATAVALAAGSGEGSSAEGPRSAGERGGGKGGVELRRIARFDSPVFVTAAPEVSDLLFVVERGGRIRVLKDGEPAGKFLDISNRVSTDGERGLLSVAFPPNYERSRRFYVYLTNRRGDIEVVHYRRSSDSRIRARRGSRKRILRIPHRAASNHNGGTLAFGPDKLLYLATGDGGGGGDPDENAQNKSSLLGKLLRIDPRPTSARRYAIPKGNPFRGRPGENEIFAIGLRNPFRFSFDRRKPLIAIGDVGQNRFEEVDYLRLRKARGANFGWDAFEGRHAHDTAGDDEASVSAKRHDPPMHEYSHKGGNCSVTGGLTVRDGNLPSLRGRYLYADLCGGELRSFKPRLKRNRARGDRALGISVDQPVGFGEDSKGRPHVVSLAGDVYRLAPK